MINIKIYPFKLSFNNILKQNKQITYKFRQQVFQVLKIKINGYASIKRNYLSLL